MNPMGTSKESILKSLLVLNFSKINFLRNKLYRFQYATNRGVYLGQVVHLCGPPVPTCHVKGDFTFPT